MILLNKKNCYLTFVLLVGMQSTIVNTSSAPIYYPAGLNSVIDSFRFCDKSLLFACGGILFMGACWFITSGKKQKKLSQQVDHKPQLQLLTRDTNSELVRAVINDVTSPPMLICGIDNTLKNIQKILQYIKTVEAFESLLPAEQRKIRNLIKIQEDLIEAEYTARGLPVLSSIPAHTGAFQQLIQEGLPLDKIGPDKDFYACTGIPNQPKDGAQQIEHLLQYHPREYFFVKINLSGHVIYRERAKLYAHLTHHYKQAVGSIVKMLENTKTDDIFVKVHKS